jgi:nucleotide-binding universal stress UspA family protein
MKYLVPYDFSPITRTALDHALMYARRAGASIELFHVIEKEAQRPEIEGKFEDLLKSLDEKDRDIVAFKIDVGDIFKDISKEAEKANAQLVIMGTHGAKGLQKLFGSHAIKVITSSNVPFIVTQAKGPEEDIKRLAFPVNLARESVQILRFVKVLAKKYDAEIHLLGDFESDEWLAKKINTNVKIVQNDLNKEGIKHEVHILNGKGSYYDEVIDYCAKYRADMIAITHFSDSIFPQFDKFTQEIITNKLELPVLVVNARHISSIVSDYPFMYM